jgi:hypothetical protein
MSEKRYQIAYGEEQQMDVVRANDREPGDFLSREEAARRIVEIMDGVISRARLTRRRAKRIIRIEEKKVKLSGERGALN